MICSLANNGNDLKLFVDIHEVAYVIRTSESFVTTKILRYRYPRIQFLVLPWLESIITPKVSVASLIGDCLGVTDRRRPFDRFRNGWTVGETET